MADYYTYSLYLHGSENFDRAVPLVIKNDTEESLKRLGLAAAIAELDEHVENVSIDKANGIQISLMGRKVNPHLLLASKKLGCEFIRVDLDCDSSDYQGETFYHRGKKIVKEHALILQRVYCPELAQSQRLSLLFHTRDLPALTKELDDGLDPNMQLDGQPLLFKSVACIEATEYLLDHGADPDVLNDNGQTLLMSIIANEEREYTHIAHLLIAQGANLHLEMADEEGSILWHAMAWDQGLARAMQDKGAKLIPPENTYDNDEPEYQLTTAIYHHDSAKVDELFELQVADEEETKELVDACVDADNLPVLKRLIETGYDLSRSPDMEEEEEGKSQPTELLQAALSSCSFDVAMYLMEQTEDHPIDWSEFSACEIEEVAGHPGATELLKTLLPHLKEHLNAPPRDNGLCAAIDSGSTENVRALIDAGAPLNYEEEEGYCYPVLADAVTSLNAPMVELLIAAGADPFMQFDGPEQEESGSDNQTPRSAATMVLKERLNRDPKVVSLFKQAMEKQPAESQIWEVIQQDNLAGLQKVFPRLNNPSITNGKGETPLQFAIQNKRTSLAQWLIEQKVDLSFKDKEGNSPLALSVLHRQPSLIPELIRSGASANDKVCLFEQEEMDENADKMMSLMGMEGENLMAKIEDATFSETKLSGTDSTALMVAANKGHLDTLQALVTAQADLELLDDTGRTAISYAAENGYLDCVKYLHEHGAQAANTWKDGSILTVAAYKGHMDVCQYLVETAGVDINLKAGNRETALIAASRTAFFHASEESALLDNRETVDILTPLLELGADIDAQNKDGEFALLLCTMMSHFKGINLLLSKGASTDLISADSDTAYSLAEGIVDLPEDFDIETMKPKHAFTEYKQLLIVLKNLLMYLVLPIIAVLGGAYYFSPTLAIILVVIAMLAWGWVIVSRAKKKKKQEKVSDYFGSAADVIGKVVLNNAQDQKKDNDLLDEWEEAKEH